MCEGDARERERVEGSGTDEMIPSVGGQRQICIVVIQILPRYHYRLNLACL